MHHQQCVAPYVDISLYIGNSEPDQLLHSVLGCRLSGLTGCCSATWYGDALVVSSSSLVGEPLGSPWHRQHIHTCNVPKYEKTPWLDYRCNVTLLGYPPHLLTANKLVPFDSKQCSQAPLTTTVIWSYSILVNPLDYWSLFCPTCHPTISVNCQSTLLLCFT